MTTCYALLGSLAQLELSLQWKSQWQPFSSTTCNFKRLGLQHGIWIQQLLRLVTLSKKKKSLTVGEKSAKSQQNSLKFNREGWLQVDYLQSTPTGDRLQNNDGICWLVCKLIRRGVLEILVSLKLPQFMFFSEVGAPLDRCFFLRP